MHHLKVAMDSNTGGVDDEDIYIYIIYIYIYGDDVLVDVQTM